MPAEITKWITSALDLTINKVSCLAEDDSYVYFLHRRVKKFGDFTQYHDSWLKARDFLETREMTHQDHHLLKASEARCNIRKLHELLPPNPILKWKALRHYPDATECLACADESESAVYVNGVWEAKDGGDYAYFDFEEDANLYILKCLREQEEALKADLLNVQAALKSKNKEI